MVTIELSHIKFVYTARKQTKKRKEGKEQRTDKILKIGHFDYMVQSRYTSVQMVIHLHIKIQKLFSAFHYLEFNYQTTSIMNVYKSFV